MHPSKEKLKKDLKRTQEQKKAPLPSALKGRGVGEKKKKKGKVHQGGLTTQPQPALGTLMGGNYSLSITLHRRKIKTKRGIGIKKRKKKYACTLQNQNRGENFQRRPWGPMCNARHCKLPTRERSEFVLDSEPSNQKKTITPKKNPANSPEQGRPHINNGGFSEGGGVKQNTPQNQKKQSAGNVH